MVERKKKTVSRVKLHFENIILVLKLQYIVLYLTDV